jgi:hypothetical protein
LIKDGDSIVAFFGAREKKGHDKWAVNELNFFYLCVPSPFMMLCNIICSGINILFAIFHYHDKILWTQTQVGQTSLIKMRSIYVNLFVVFKQKIKTIIYASHCFCGLFPIVGIGLADLSKQK